ncbi:DUF6252 family protein [Pedobacter sp. PWIIR3]
MRKVFIGFLLLTMVIIACKKNPVTKQPEIQPTKGKVFGIISPVNSAAQLTLINSQNVQADAYTVKPDDKGYFIFPEVTEGHYIISITQTTGYIKPRDTTFLMPKSGNIDLGNLKLQPTVTVVEPVKPNPVDEGKVNITGKFYPADAAIVAYLDGKLGHYYAEPDRTTGLYNFKNVPEGEYELSYIATAGYVAPVKRSISIAKNVNTDLGILTFAPNQRVSQLSFKLSNTDLAFDTYLNNFYKNTGISVSYVGSKLQITGSSSSGSYQSITGIRTKRLTIKLDGVTGPGTYICQGTESSEILYTDKATAGLTYSIDVGSDKESAKVIITAFDPAAKTISGTFSGTLRSKTGTKTTTQELSTGIFNIKY